ncbi:MAG: enoyl-CoA hydratase/isomerase family protein [Chloroflexi bacterium]|nr:enoyl-CoA hydratase/isomerase family protein [Chloroflexota bacterium]
MAIDFRKEGHVAYFTINRPEALNSMNLEGTKQLTEAMIAFRDDSELWAGIITGAGEKAFCSGADIRDVLPFMKEHRQEPWAFPPTIMRGLELWKPLIAAINGYALGGGLELAMACDIRIASENARLGTPEVALGLIPGWGGTQRLPRAVPWCKAAELLLTGKPIDAQEAYRIGLVNRVVPLADLMKTAREYADAICTNAPLAVQAAKQAMYKGYDLTMEDGLRLESSLVASVMATEDFSEGTAAFLERRKPQYKAK